MNQPGIAERLAALGLKAAPEWIEAVEVLPPPEEIEPDVVTYEDGRLHYRFRETSASRSRWLDLTGGKSPFVELK